MSNRTVKQEIIKQLIDQPLHIVMGVVSVCFFAWAFAKSDHNIIYATLLTTFWIVFREYSQWPCSRWYDPPIDWFFEAVGIVLGVYVWYQIGVEEWMTVE